MTGQIRDLRELHPKFLPRVERWLSNCKDKGYDLLVVETRRTFAVAYAYYTQGRLPPLEVAYWRKKAGLPTISLKECNKIITRAKPGLSWHIYGLAVDFVPMMDRRLLDWKYNPEDPNDDYDEIANEAEALGMTWGGEFRSFKDYPHVEWHPGWDDPVEAQVWMQNHDNWQIPIAA